MSLMTAIEVGASGLSAQRRRLDVHVENLVNSQTVRPAGMQPYQQKDVIFSTSAPKSSFGAELDDAIQGVEVSGVVTIPKEPRKKYEPEHPFADKEGNVLYPDINSMEEMVNVMSATRSYEANLQAVNMAKEMQQKTLEILR
jgi:flagellar basal-body rod protein FlgC